MKVPSHKILIDRYLDWDLVKDRLNHYKNINRFFPLNKLVACSNKSPYYCHFLSWRLGTWGDENLFDFFDTLLANAMNLPNWHKSKIPNGCKFEDFWSFLWELQVAQMFLNKSASIEWTNSGPDLKVITNVGEFFVECTIYRKSFALEDFIEDLLSKIDVRIKVEHIPFFDFSLPNNAVEPFLDELFQPLLNDTFLQEILKESESISPIQLPKPKYAENFYVFVENKNAIDTNLDNPWEKTGSPDIYLENLMVEILEKKRGSNKLRLHKPNLLAVNLLLDKDFQIANALRKLPLPILEDFEALFLAKCGIDEIPSLGNQATYFYDNHPIKFLTNK